MSRGGGSAGMGHALKLSRGRAMRPGGLGLDITALGGGQGEGSPTRRKGGRQALVSERPEGRVWVRGA